MASPHGETISLLVRALADQPQGRRAVCRDVLEQIAGIYGSCDACRPARHDVMKLAWSQRKLSVEAKVRSCGHGVLYGALYRLWLNW